MERGVLVVGESLVDIVQTPSGRRARVRRRQRGERRGRAGPAGSPDPAGDELRAGPPRRADRRPPRERRCAARLRPVRGGAHVDRRGHDPDVGRGGVHLRDRLAAAAGGRGRGPAGGAHLLARGGAAARCRRRAGPARPAAGAVHGELRRERASGRDRHRTGRRRAGRADGGGRRPGQGERRGPRGALPGADVRRLGGRAARARAGGGRGDSGRRGSALVGPRRPRWRSRRGRCRSPTRSAPATPSGPASWTRSGSAGGSGPRVARRWPRCPAPRSSRCSSTPPGPRPSRSPARARTRRTGTSSKGSGGCRSRASAGRRSCTGVRRR